MANTLHTVGDVKAYFRLLIDEPDESYVTDAQIEQMLGIAEDEYRNYIARIDPQAIMAVAVLAFVNTDTYYLNGGNAVILFGPTASLAPAGTRLVRADQLYEVTDDPPTNVLRPSRLWTLKPDAAQLRFYEFDAWALDLALGAPRVLLSRAFTGNLYLRYLGTSTTDWTAGVDELNYTHDTYHDLIALIAVEQYEARDGGTVPNVAARREKRERDMEEMVFSRGFSAHQFVRDDGYQSSRG